MSTRLRLVASMLIFAAVGSLYAAWAAATLGVLYAHYAHHSLLGVCGSDWRYSLNGCTRFYPYLSWFELLGATLLMAAVAALLVRWTQYPLRAMARSVDSFGPTNLAQRLDAGSGAEGTRQLGEAINDMLARVADGYEAQRRFAASASHELRTPLATQRALVEVSLARPLTPEQQELLARQLLAANERNVTVIDGLLTLAEAEQGLAARDVVDLGAVVRDAIAASADHAARHGVTMTSSLRAADVRGERALLDRLVMNLLRNAITYNVEGGRVCVELSDAPPTLRVENTGRPVPGQEVGRLFEPFHRLAGDRIANTDGAGLGLTIVRSIVTAHGGTVVATANAGGGLTLSVQLPAAARPAHDPDD